MTDFIAPILLPPDAIAIDNLFSSFVGEGNRRSRRVLGEGIESVMESFCDSNAVCCFLRVDLNSARRLSFTLADSDEIASCAAGGWLLTSVDVSRPSYWIPQWPKFRTFDTEERILSEADSTLISFESTESGLRFVIEASACGSLDAVIWQLQPEDQDLLTSLTDLSVIESQSYFLYGSHTAYSKPADLYLHLIHGQIYENLFSWPNRWKIPDELDAYALYLVLAGLEQATQKRLYRLMKRQVLSSVFARQREDGGWYHGEWTKGMECHVRLHCGAMHLLATALEEQDDPVVAQALRQASIFLTKLTDNTAMGTWFLHDSLECSREGMDASPFPWLPSRALGKSDTNMLVLNTHLDALIALDRYRKLTGDTQFDGIIVSGQQATTDILARRPAESLYRFLYRLIDLTLLPVTEAKRLPVHTRAMKRLTWKYLIPRMHYIRTRWPRLVMPNGFIDRALSLSGVSHAYQAVNIWDLIRYRRRFPKQDLADVIHQALAYTQNTMLRAFWAESQNKGHALGFWIEALWHLCLADPDSRYRGWLSEAMFYFHDAGFGMPPAILGANTEAVSARDRVACLSLADRRLRIVNLSRIGQFEFLIVNPTKEEIAVTFETEAPAEMIWTDSNGAKVAAQFSVLPRDWIVGRASLQQIGV